mgnify:CR=1 FL=1
MNTSTICRALAILLCCLTCAYTYAQDRPEYVRGQVLIKMKADKTAAQKSTLKTQIRVTKQRSLKNDIEVWNIDESNGEVDIKQLVEQYRNHEDVEFAVPNHYYFLADAKCNMAHTAKAQDLVPNDPNYGLQWGMSAINAPAAWDIASGSPYVKVAILDTGMYWKHEDLIENMWHNLCEDADGDGKVIEKVGCCTWQFDEGDIDGIDGDGNGYVDDFIGWDFVNGDNNPDDTSDSGHGTHVAGILGATADNGVGVAGVTSNVQLISIKVFENEDRATTADMIDAINYAVSIGAQISNNSWGGGQYNEALELTIQSAANAGHLFVAAAGNAQYGNGDDIGIYKFYPASYNSDNILVVAATNSLGELADFSNYGATAVDIAAPGDSIYSCMPVNSYGYLEGTSMATPHIAGACALLWGLQHEKSYSDIITAITQSATQTPELNNKTVSDGQLNLYDALTYFTPVPAPQTPPTEPCPSLCRMNDSLALVALYNANPGDLSYWDLNDPIDDFYGVILSEKGCVIGLSIDFPIDVLPPEIGDMTNLESISIEEGGISVIPEEIGNLTKLKLLKIQRHAITSIPPEIGNLSNLERLDLESNIITTLPPEIGNLQNLTKLQLGGNELTNFPIEITDLTNLRILSLWSNQITSIPPEIQNLNELETLNLNSNQITTLSPQIGEPNKLEFLYLSSNQITTLPQEIGDLRNLKELYLQANQITSIPLEIGSLTNLEILYLSSNDITNIPITIGSLSSLRVLRLNSNLITGGLPKEIGDLQNLTYFAIQYNYMSGCHPPELINLCDMSTSVTIDYGNNNFDATWSDFCDTGAGVCSIAPCRQSDSLNLVALYNATNGASWLNRWYLHQPVTTWHGVTTNALGCVIELDLSNNDLIGTIPLEIGDLNLLNLDLSNNFLSGTIPISMENMSRLVTLDLSDNQLSDNIPPELGNLTQLTVLNLSDNFLDGNIPLELGELTKLTTLDLSDNSLTGTIPFELGTLLNLNNLYLFDNELSGNIPYTFDDLYYLDRMWLSGNQLSGCFPNNLSVLCNRIDATFNTNYYITDGNSFGVAWEDFCAGLYSSSSSCEAVWPGDLNNDGTANEEDVLAWGLASGSTGPERNWLRQGTPTVWSQGTPTTDWFAQPATQWAQSVDGVNSMHQDGDGNGVVDGDDLQVIYLNFNRIHSFGAPQSISADFVYRLERRTTSGGDPVYDLHVEDMDGNPISAHGLAFEFDFELLNVSEVMMDISASSLQPSSTFELLDEVENKFYGAITRTNGTDILCNGPVASFIIITNDIPTGDPFEMRVRGGKKIESDGQLDDILGISNFDVYPDDDIVSGQLLANVSVLHAQCLSYGYAAVNAVGGTPPYSYQWNTGETTERINDLTSGIYQVTISDAVGASESFTITVEGQYLPIYDDNGNLIDCIDGTCPTLLTPGGTIPEGLYQADRTINSDGTLTGDTDYKAGETIIFGNGFEIPPGTEFSGTIEDCDDN